MAKQFLDITGLGHLWKKIKDTFTLKSEHDTLQSGVNELGLEVSSNSGEITLLKNNKADKTEVTPIATKATANASAIETLKTNKQDKLVSGTNIKTIEGQSLLGTGNIPFPKTDLSNYYTKTEVNGKIKNQTDSVITNLITHNSVIFDSLQSLEFVDKEKALGEILATLETTSIPNTEIDKILI